MNSMLKYGFCMKLILSECNSNQVNISWPFLSSLLGGCNSKATPNPPKSDDKNVEEMFTKCSTAKSFIRTEMTTYRIGALKCQLFQKKKGKNVQVV